MMISTKGRYALRVMIDLAEHQADGYIPLKVIAERQDISEKYLESILKALVREKILTGLRGKGGGYRLAKPPERCTVGSILRLTEGSLAPVAGLEDDAYHVAKAGCHDPYVFRRHHHCGPHGIRPTGQRIYYMMGQPGRNRHKKAPQSTRLRARTLRGFFEKWSGCCRYLFSACSAFAQTAFSSG